MTMEMTRRLRSLLSTPLPPATRVARRNGTTLSMACFLREALCWRAAFAEMPGSRVALYFDDTVSFAAALFALWSVGKTAVVPGDLTPAMVQALAADVHALATDLPAAPTSLARVLASEEPGVLPAEPLDSEQPLLAIFTSGSTGAPAAIPKRLRQLFAEVDALESAFGARMGAAEVMGLVSHQHIYGLLFRVLWPLAAARTFHAERVPYVETLLQHWPAESRAAVIASPAHLKRLPQQPCLDTARLALSFSSGGALPQEALPDCQRVFGQPPIEIFGSSETGGIAWRQQVAPSGASTAGWTVLPGIDWRVAAEGKLQLRSAHLPMPGEWYDSADRVRSTEGGFELLGRADRILKIEGTRVSALAIEGALLATGLLAELRVFVLDAPGREQLAVLAQPNEAGWRVWDAGGRPAMVARLRSHLIPLVDRVVLPKRWRFVSQLPANDQGKTTLDAMRAQFDPRRPAVRVLSQEAGQVVLHVDIDAALPQFQGHFLQHPVLPGVAQLDWVMLFARELLGLENVFAGIEGLKFQQVIRPGMAVELHLSYRAPLLSFVYRSAQGQHASGKVRIGGAA